jgi:hypothetical protein
MKHEGMKRMKAIWRGTAKLCFVRSGLYKTNFTGAYFPKSLHKIS